MEQVPNGDLERSFVEIHSSRFTAAPGSCQGVTGDDGEMRVRFVLTDGEVRPIRLGETVDHQSVELGPESLTFSNSDISVVAGPSVQFVADNDEHQVFGLLLENAGSLDGFVPPGARGHWDKNGNGVTGDREDMGVPDFRLRETATDVDERRLAAVLGTYTSWQRAYRLARAEGRETFFGVWTFDSTALQPTSHVAQASSETSEWTQEQATVEASIASDYRNAPPTPDARANVYEAITNVIDGPYSESAMTELGVERPGAVDKQLVVFVDGYDDMREMGSEGIGDAIRAAREHNVRVFVVHLDPALEEPTLLREDPMYPEGQTPCSDDTECKNYETCRKPRGYTENAGDTVESPGTYDIDQTYCLPEHDAAGRVGPIHDYARLACETGGGYIYAPSAEQLGYEMAWTPLALDGLWEARVESAAFKRGEVASGEAYQVQTEMSADVAGTVREYSFSEQGGPGAEFDTRGVVFAR
ncbi:VWA domain-containing protein [Persicimonas caeni]|uniref:VWA domain-containing protein n=1 Tax=Persicimonas caeni TaxID=2292766 RepID=A0A4Y6PRX8_PERCE|nr:VWA domain-containing protein [Persicimonas caeni]QDG50869.1 VWA domain-containing protein [Persicimonas caeni]QED32090.1 VWA domain-containing protein [Persicimonas caeni]